MKRNQSALADSSLGEKRRPVSQEPLVGSESKGAANISGFMLNTTRSQCGETTMGQNCDNLDLKKNNDCRGLKKTESMKSQ